MNEDELAHSKHTKDRKRGRWPWPDDGAFDGCLAPGEYFKPGKGVDVTVVDARQRFLTAIKIVAPEVLATLEADVFPAFRTYKETWEKHYGTSMPIRAARRDIPKRELTGKKEILGVQDDRGLAVHDQWFDSAETKAKLESGELVLKSSPKLLDLAKLKSELSERAHEWANRFRIDLDWIHDEALLAMSELTERTRLQVEKDRPLEDFAPLWGSRLSVWGVPLSSRETSFRPKLREGWEPTCERWDEFRARALKELAEKLGRYGERIRKRVEAKGFVPAPRVKEPVHFRWLVERVVRKRSWAQIADAPGYSREMVRSAVKSAAKLAKIPLPLDKLTKKALNPD